MADDARSAGSRPGHPSSQQQTYTILAVREGDEHPTMTTITAAEMGSARPGGGAAGPAGAEPRITEHVLAYLKNGEWIVAPTTSAVWLMTSNAAMIIQCIPYDKKDRAKLPRAAQDAIAKAYKDPPER